MRMTPGQSVGRYVIESLLGEGGMGEVYRARDSKLERAVALKVLRKDKTETNEARERAVLRMQLEARAVAALSHSGIVAIYDIGEEDDLPFIAMELVEGQPLRELIGQDVPLDKRIRILLDVAKALGAAHKAGLVHCDIKPENILIRQDGAPKILDFGIARKMLRGAEQFNEAAQQVDPKANAAEMGKRAGQGVVGTPAYMSPEQLHGEVADARADQFGWSVVAYEFLSGKHPFQKDTRITQVIGAILRDKPEPLVDLPERLIQAIMRGLEKNPKNRWLSMEEIVNHCDDLGTTMEAGKYPQDLVPPRENSAAETGISKTTMVQRAHWRRVIMPVIAVVGVIVGIAFSLRKSFEPTPPGVVIVAAPSGSIAMKITDLPIPTSMNTVAIREFRQGMQNIRDARWGAAATAFQQALTADPEMASAHLRYAIVQFSTNAGQAREAYRKAFGMRLSMSDRDQGFLHAHEPLILRDPPDLSEATKRMEALSSRYPNDVELGFWHGQTLFDSSSDPASIERSERLFHHCVELDPHYADCWQSKSKALFALGRHEESSKALDECIKRSEISADCMLDKIVRESHLGHCDIVIELAQQLRAKEPIAPRGSRFLAQALYNQGAGETVVRNAYVEAKQRMKSNGLLFDAEYLDVSASIDYGDFSTAIEKADDIHRTIAYPNVETEYAHYWLRGDLLSEINKVQDAARIAEEFLTTRPLRGQSKSKSHIDVTVLMHVFRLQAGNITPQDFRKLRTDWLESQPQNTDLEKTRNWLAAYAMPAKSLEFAREALDAKPRPLAITSLDQGRYSKLFATLHARVFALAEKYEEALPMLEETTRICTTGNISLWQTQNYAFLGITREATGDKPGACRAYQIVLSRWGRSNDSRTIKEVRKRMTNLRCS